MKITVGLLALVITWGGIGSAVAADKDINPCEGMADGELMGVEVCNECHEDKVSAMRMNPHGQAADDRTPYAREGCETCHGSGTIHFEVEGNCIISLRGKFGESVEQRNGICLQCHQSGQRLHWQGSTHEGNDIACVNCHSIHGTRHATDRHDEAGICYDCHAPIRAKTYQPYGHPLRHQKMRCSDCHNPHGATAVFELKGTSINDTCYECHPEKRGPFLWEHFPVTENCTLCHDVHGSIHRGALARRPPHLCQECHMQQIGANHARQLYDFDVNDGSVSRGLLAHGCLNCHSQVHGTNHPSGAALMR